MENTNWHARPMSDVTDSFHVDTTKGLSKEEVLNRQKKYGLNTLPKGKEVHWWQILFYQFRNPLIIILLTAAIITFWLGEHLDTIVIGIAILLNITISFWQEFRSNNIFEKLQKLITIKTKVRRDGVIYEINSEDIVPGDVILLRVGSKVPADARLLSVEEFEVNEALLTGESASVEKIAEDSIDEKTALADRVNMVYTGTVVGKGNAEAVVVATGKHTELGKIAELTVNVDDEKTPLQERLSSLSKKIAFLVILLALIIFVVGISLRGDIVEMFTIGVAIAVGAIPEGLPAAMSIVLAVASQKILRKKGLVKTLIGAETLGSTTVICTDKTGTLTEGIMKVESLHHTNDKGRASLIMALANEAEIIDGNEVSGETTDKAKLEYFLAEGGNLKEALDKCPRLYLSPFNSEDKIISSFHKTSENKLQVFVTGAPEKLLKLSTKSEKERKEIAEEIEKLASQGFRLIGMAERVASVSSNFDYKNKEELNKLLEKLEFSGIAAIRDPIRPDVKESVDTVRHAGIRTIMITGDHKLTARSIGQELNFRIEEKNIVEGVELDNMSKEELRERIKDIDIIARANPKHKMLIIEALRSNGDVVAMTGDGVNDAPALKSADIGVALGAGTDVTKEAADLVLVNDGFSTIVSAVREGRVAFDNIRKVTIFTLAGAFTTVILILVSLVAAIPFLAITAVQILWANLVEDGLPALSLAFEPGEKDIMKRSPFKRIEPIINKLGYYIIILVGIVSDFVLVALFLGLVNFSSYDQIHIQSIMFAAVGIDTLMFIFSIKTLNQSAFSRSAFNNKFLNTAVIIGFTLMFASIYLPTFNVLLGTIPLGLLGISLAFGTGVFRLLFIETVKFFVRRKGFFHHHSHHQKVSSGLPA